jgi:hypothetical protein
MTDLLPHRTNTYAQPTLIEGELCRPPLTRGEVVFLRASGVLLVLAGLVALIVSLVQTAVHA